MDDSANIFIDLSPSFNDGDDSPPIREYAAFGIESANRPQRQFEHIDPNCRPKNCVIVPKDEDIVANSLLRPPVSETASGWCNITYYELDEKVGDTYKSTARRVTIDGHCTTSDNSRFCLGMMINPSQNPVSAKIRPMIGKGCTIYQSAELGAPGDVEIECCSESPIFVQSPVHAASAGDDLSTVYRLPRGAKMSVFKRTIFDDMLNQARRDGYAAVYALSPMCNIRVSFVKGYGAHYNRPTVTTTPCWIEVQFLEPLQAVACAMDAIEVPKINIPMD